jgi:hypothetical protein
MLYLKSGAFIPEKNINPENIDAFKRQATQISGRQFAVIQFEKILSKEQRAILQSAGVELLDYIPDNAYTVTISGALDANLLTNLHARSLIQLSPQQKMQPELAAGIFPAWSVKKPGTIDIRISFPRTYSYEAVVNELMIRNYDLISVELKQYRVLSLRIAATRLNEIASLPFIEYVEPVPPADQALNYNSMFASRANVLKASAAVGGKNLNGQDVVVGVGDNGDIQSHLDFTNRLINRAGEITRAHASHVAGTIAGAGIIRELYTGYAPKATIVSQVFSKIFTQSSTYVQDHGMVITNNSFGTVTNDCNYNGLYDLSSRILDQQAFDFPELQHVFAAGNDGFRNCSPYPVGFKTVLGGYQSAKNVLTVGSTDYKSDVSSFSSKGPVRDGRLKPEIMSQGQFVASTWVDNIYSYNNGTSMAAPGVSGGLALLVQRYRQLHGGTNPENGLMKAIICNGGDDKGTTGADYSYGLGRLNLLRSVTMLENSNYYNSSLSNGSNVSYGISVPANTAQLKVLLYWQDPPAAVMAARTLVNDLDLEVITPSSTTILPWKLDTLPANVANAATTGADHINNIEQVVINNPIAGNYSLKTIASAIVQNPTQEFWLVYDIIPESLVLTNPVGNEGLWPTISNLDTGYIQWDAYGGPANPFTLEFTADEGLNWSTLSSTVPATSRIFSWVIPDIPTEKARIRITKNGTAFTQTSSPFTITSMPVDSLTPDQCEGYIKLGWRSVPGATDYEAMMLRGDEMVSIGTTTGLNYTFGGLSKDSVYWVTVRPRINSKPGRRALAISRQPNSGSCAGTISDNDLKIDSLLSPSGSGRLFTSTALSSTVPITIRIRNLDDAVSTDDITVSYSINGGAPVSTTLTGGSATIPALGTIDYTFAGTVDLSSVNTYSIEVTATKASDPVVANNSLTRVIRQLDNQPITLASLPWLDNLESATVQTHTARSMGLTGRDRYDFTNSTSYGRIRTFVNTGLAYSGNRALTLDMYRNISGGNVDSLTGTFNLSTFNIATDDIRLDFRYKNHGQASNAANAVWIRGSEADPWIKVYDLYANQLSSRSGYKLAGSIELSDSLAAYAQTFGTGFQVRWGQWGDHMTADADSRSGYSFDDIRIYKVVNDVQAISINMNAIDCGLGNAENITATIRNTANTMINNIPVVLRVNGIIAATETIASIPASSSIDYTFNPGTADLSAAGDHLIEVWVDLASDTYHENDTTVLEVNNLPLVTSFPYLQNFELNDGAWYTGGSGSSWEYGSPVSPKINRAASGSKAWKTNIAGYYNNQELSYLYSPCFDVSGMTNPTLSFSLALDMEDCGVPGLCDGAWVEYSNDNGATWTKLGAMGQGTNWYNRDYSGNQVWSQQDYHRWHVATTSLPTSNNDRLRFRFVFDSDEAISKDGMAIDDIHIYDNTFGIYEGPTMGAPVSQNITGGSSWINFTSGGKLIASLQPNNQAMGNTDVQAYIHTGSVRNFSGQYYHNRNITIKPGTINLTDSATVRFYFLDSETEALISATGCASCTKPSSAYDLGVSKYSDNDDAREDGDVVNSFGGVWSFIHSSLAVKVPFDKGYYAEFKVKNFSEFWLNNGGFDNNQPLPVQLLQFTATKLSNGKDVLVSWKTASENDVNRFEIEVAKGYADYGSNMFVKIGEQDSQGNSSTEQSYSFTDHENGKSGVRYYRLKMIDNDGSFSYSVVRPVVFTDDIQWQVFPNPSRGMVHLVFQAAQGEKLDLQVYDAGGRLVYRSSVIATGFIQRFPVDLGPARFAKGLYLIEAGTGSRRSHFRILKN